MRSSGRNNPCPMCDRTKDGDCRITDNGIVLCHTELNGVKKGERHPERPFIYCGHSEKAQGFGTWMPEHLCEERPEKARREAKTQYFDYCFWDGSPTPAQRYRKDFADGRPKEVKWCSGGLQGRPQTDVAPYCWHEMAPRAADGEQLFVAKGELKVQELQAAGCAAVSILGFSEQLVDNLRAYGTQIVLTPDCDHKDLDGWYRELSDQLPEALTLMPSLKGMNWRTPPKDGGLGVEDWLQQSKPDAGAIQSAITSNTWKPDAEQKSGAKGDLEKMGWTNLLDYILKSIRQNSPDHEMKARAELKNRFRISDEQLNTALFKRHGEGRLLNVKPAHDSVSMAKVETLQYQLDGWIQKGDVGLLYGAYGTGKTTLALWKAYHLAKGINILDRNTPCTPARSLIIATDSGLGPLKKSLEDLGLDPDNDPLFQPGHPDQMIYIWGYDPAQGHGSWICDIQGIIRLEQFIELKNIAYVAIDSAKSVSSVAGWSYTSNESVKALLKHLREVVATPTDSFIEFLSHDGTEKGMHSGAKAWAEDPSLVCRLELQKDEATGQESVRCEFKKDRAAAVDPRRKLTYFLEDCQLKLAPEVEVVSTCEDAIVEVLWSAHQNNVPSVKTNELKSEVYARFRKTSKTVENTLPRINKKRIVSPRRGSWYLSPSEIQRLEAKHSSSNRDPYVMGRVNSKPTASVDVCLPPDPVLTSGVRGVRNIPKPPISPRGGRSGGSETLVAHNVLTFTPPVEGRANPKTNSDLSDWMQDDEEII